MEKHHLVRHIMLKKIKVIDEVYFDLDEVIIGATPKNAKISDNENYTVIATQ